MTDSNGATRRSTFQGQVNAPSVAPQSSSDSPVVDFSPLTPESREQLLADVQSHRFRNEAEQ